MLSANRNPVAPGGCSRLAIELIGFVVVWSLAMTAVLFINHRFGQADSRELAVPLAMIGPIFWFIFRFLPRKGGWRKEPDSDET